ncbi:hypothetical protein [uncultured Selenomonas sp.]|uniref:hypothetical protein n=1 Tax=uncultured Selenomonas sp. TaxID=159275 RepID=UPI0025FB8D60|nr:hypothetical protein [uncultured Selenomonas sp.]
MQAIRENIPDELKQDSVWILAPYAQEEIPHWQPPNKWMFFKDVHSDFPALVLPSKILCIELLDVLDESMHIKPDGLDALNRVLAAGGATYVEVMQDRKGVHALYHVGTVPATYRKVIPHTGYRGMKMRLPFGGAYVGLGRVVVMTGYTRKPRAIATARKGIFTALARMSAGIGEMNLF